MKLLTYKKPSKAEKTGSHINPIINDTKCTRRARKKHNDKSLTKDGKSAAESEVDTDAASKVPVDHHKTGETLKKLHGIPLGKESKGIISKQSLNTAMSTPGNKKLCTTNAICKLLKRFDRGSLAADTTHGMGDTIETEPAS